MSINVTVHGNPISIKKGKMVTYDADNEFDRRRKIRLQQVREQSKEIAADVRNRVRKEKEKQLSKAAKKGEQDLKRWQARKLLALQEQYQDCLKEVGTAHTKAALEPDPNEVLSELAAKNQAQANVREKIAIEKKRHEDTQKQLKLEEAEELKKYARMIEDTRAAMVTRLSRNADNNRKAKKKKNKRKKIATDVTITNNLVTDETTENFTSDAENISANIIDDESSRNKKKNELSIDLTTPTLTSKNKTSIEKPTNFSITDTSFEVSSVSTDYNDSKLPQSPTRSNENLHRSILSPNITPTISLNKEDISQTTAKHKKSLSKSDSPSSSPKKSKTISLDLNDRSRFLSKTKNSSEEEDTNIVRSRSPSKDRTNFKTNSTPSLSIKKAKQMIDQHTYRKSTKIADRIQRRKSEPADNIKIMSSPSSSISSSPKKSKNKSTEVEDTNIVKSRSPSKDRKKFESKSTQLSPKKSNQHRYGKSTKIADRIQRRKSELADNTKIMSPSSSISSSPKKSKNKSVEDKNIVRSRSPSKNRKKFVTNSPRLSPKKTKQMVDQHCYGRCTKIADRIQRRKSEPTNNTFEDESYYNYIHNIQKPYKRTIRSKEGDLYLIQDSESVQDFENHSNFCISKLDECSRPTKLNHQIKSYKICDIPGDPERSQYLPYVPTTSLRPETLTCTSDSQPCKVKYYDRINHFGKEYHAQPVVRKISKHNIQVNPSSPRSEPADLLKASQVRDKIASSRGRKAMEKQKIQKDYKQLLDELPLLQRQERMASLGTHNSAFHMPEDRLEELERRRQVKIENIFEKYYNKSKILETPLITIRPVQKTPPAEEMKLPFRALDITESPVELNVAQWKTEDITVASEPEYRQEDLQTRQQALVDLLQRVNRQRELLLQEVSTLPPSSNLQKILQDEEILKLISPSHDNEKPKEVQEKVKTLVNTGTSPLSVRSPSKLKQNVAKRGPVTTSSCSDSSGEIKKKKHKTIKSKKQKILIRNEGTQTSPITTSTKSYSYETKTEEPQTIRSCSCKTSETTSKTKCSCSELLQEDTKKLCEIIINMTNQGDVQVSKDKDQVTDKRLVVNVSKPTKISIRSPSNGNDGSSSTTYLSLPEQKLIKTQSVSKDRIQYKDLLHSKPQQTNVDQTDKAQETPPTDPPKKEITPSLLRYIQKLLSMSRQSIDELTVSSISDVSTPGTSIIDTAENNSPFARLQSVMNYYNLSFTDIQKHLTSADTSKSSAEYSATEIRTEGKATYTTATSTNDFKVVDRVERLPSPINIERPCSSRDVVRQSSTSESVKSPKSAEEVANLVKETFGLTPNDMQDIPYANILSRYKDLTKTCCDRITKLTEMIDNVRLEKERLLSPSASDKYETSLTSYLELPKMTNDSTRRESNERKSSRHSNASSSNSSMSQEAVDKYLLTVDKIPSRNTSPTQRNSDKTTELPVSDNPNNNKNNNPEQFVPMLQGIPKYEPPKNQAMNFINSPVKQFLLSSKTRPPPSLLRNANKYNLNIDMTPHELSTIVELDTVASSRNVSEVLIPKPRSPQEKIPSKDEVDDNEASGFVTLSPENFKDDKNECAVSCPGRQLNQQKPEYTGKKSVLKQRKSVLKNSSSSSSSPQDISNAGLSGVQPLQSDRSTSSPEDVGTFLKTMGLGWAVTTLRKTHDALALSSSSSSVEASYRKRVSFKDSSNSNSNSDVSLKDVLSKEFIRKISSSTLLTDSSGNSYLQEFQDLSEIRDPTILLNREGSQQRTSTPVHQSKSTDSKQDLFTGDSDISSVRLQNEELLFLSIPDVSLDTNKSLRKSKE